MPPAMRATSESSRVQRTAWTRKRNSGVPKPCPIVPLSGRAAAVEDGPVDEAKRGTETERHREIKAGGEEIEFEGTEGRRLQRVGHRRELDRRDRRDDAGA